MTLEAVAHLLQLDPIRIKVELRFIDDYYEAGKRQLLNPHFLKTLEQYDKNRLTSEIIEKIRPYIESE
jgi:hypothetical protein